MNSWPVVEGVLELGDIEVERGGVIRGARIAWQAHGTLNAAKDYVIVYRGRPGFPCGGHRRR